jgi:two-component system NtrC family sensor kinase
MGRPFGLGLRSQLMLALVVAFGAAFVLLSVVSARLDTIDELRAPADETTVQAAADSTTARVEPTPADAARRSLFVFYLGLTAATVLLLTYVLLTYFIVRPIDRLRLASERLAAGRLRTEVPVQGAAEVARLAATFNEMAAQLRADRAALQQRLEELERTTAELSTTQDQLVRSARLAAVGRLSAGVAHEIGNPLAAIRGLLDLMQMGDLDPEQEREFVNRIQRESERIHHTIRDLLDFSRSEPSGGGRVEGSADLNEVVSDTVKLVDRQTRFRDIELAVSVDGGLPRVRGDRERLRQLLLNLLFNAADALGGKGRIEIHATNGGGVVRLTVEDDGPGIDDAILDQVFDPFVTTKAAGQGTGLGLAVCHTIVDRLGGSIDAKNRPEGGASFGVDLPIAF